MFVPDGALDRVRGALREPDLSGTRYRLGRPLGRGGMGSVWSADDVELGREVAIKVHDALRPSDGELSRLAREARVIARLEHPGIVPVHDVGRLPDGRLFYVMKLVRGERLDRWAEGRDRRAVLRLCQRVCEALAFAHARGVIHRDLKPENVMVGEFGEALVMDWGLAKELGGEAPGAAPRDAAEDEPARSDRTRDGTVMGTPAYMPPEQARGEVASLDARADVYGLGACLYAVLSGQPPFLPRPGRSVLDDVIERAPTPLRELDPSIPAPVASIVERAMAKDPGERYPSAQALSDDIGRWLDAEPVHAHREGPIERASRFATKHRALIALLGAYLVLRLLLIALSR